MLTNRPWGDVVGAGAASSRLRERNTAADRAQIRGYAQQYLSQIVHVLECVQLSPLCPSSAYLPNSVSLQMCATAYAPPLQDKRLPAPR